jgi:hypothetical protein
VELNGQSYRWIRLQKILNLAPKLHLEQLRVVLCLENVVVSIDFGCSILNEVIVRTVTRPALSGPR